jgi:hypothetical protein
MEHKRYEQSKEEQNDVKKPQSDLNLTTKSIELQQEEPSLIPLVEDSGHWIPQDPAGKKRKSHQILQESTGISRKWKQYSDRKFAGFFSGGFQLIPCAFREEPVRNHRKKSENFPVGILLPRSSDFWCFPAGIGP